MANKRRGVYLIFTILFIICLFPVVQPKQINTFAVSEQSKFAVHFIDVGQGDSIFVELPDGKTMLIDAGPKSSSEKVVEYIKNLKYTLINYLILTHSDEDHSGGMVGVFENFEIQNIYRPFVLSNNLTVLPSGEDLTGLYTSSEIYTVTTLVYAEFIKCVYLETYDSGTKSNVFVSYDGITINSSSSTDPFAIEFHTPPKASEIRIPSVKTDGYPTKLYSGAESEKKNAVSPIISLQLDGGKTFLFTGDATENTEKDFLANLDDQSRAVVSNVYCLKVAHHGGKTSSCEQFLKLTNPEIAVIMCGKDNKYGHPTHEVLTRLQSLWNISNKSHFIYRSDLNGNIVITQDGNSSFKVLLASETGSENVTTIPQWVIYVVLGIILLFILICIIVKASNKNKIVKTDMVNAKRSYKKSKKIIDRIARRK